MNATENPELIYKIITICIAVAVIAFISALYFTRKSKKEAKREIKEGLEQIYTLVEQTAIKMDELDQKFSDSIGSLSPAATQNFSLAKQFSQLLERRAEKVEELMSTRRLEDLFKAHKIITSPLENAGDHLSSLVFSSTILQLQPQDYELAINAMLTSVENELAAGKKASSYKGDSYRTERRRKFTIRGFIQSVTGDAPE